MGDRFYDSPDWRFALTTLELRTLTLLDRIASNRTLLYPLNAPTIHEGRVPSDNPKVNILHTDGFPFLSEGNRFCFGFRREGDWADGPIVWEPRFGGIVDLVDTNAEQDNADTRYVARDPWQLMYKRPFVDAAGLPPDPDSGYDASGQTGRDFLIAMLDWSELYYGEHYIDTVNGDIDDTDVLVGFKVQQGMTVGEVMDELVATGNIDIRLTAVWQFSDPYLSPFTPGDPVKIARLDTERGYNGLIRDSVIMSWDAPGRTVIGLGRMLEGAGRANSIVYHAGMGGEAATQIDDATSQARYGIYFAERFYPGQTALAAVELLAEKELVLYKNGKETIVAYPAPERGKEPLVDYMAGDVISVYATNRFLQKLSTRQRIQAIPIGISDDGIESVNALALAPTDGGEGGGGGGGGPVGGGSGGGSALLYEDWAAGVVSPWAFEGDGSSLGYGLDLLSLTVGPGSPGPNPGSFLAAAYLDGGYTGGSPGEAFAEAGMDTWYRVPIRFPVGYQATAGEFNWLVEWHVATGTPGPFSCGLGVYADGPIVDENDAPGTSPRLFFVVRYGTTGAIQERRHTMTTNIPIGSDIVNEFYFEWRTYPTVGRFEWYVNGALEWGLNTENMLDDGLANGWGMYNYHRLSNFDNTVEFGPASIAADRADL